MGYQAGCEGLPLPDSCLNSLDSHLIPLLTSSSSLGSMQVEDEVLTFEMTFSVLQVSTDWEYVAPPSDQNEQVVWFWRELTFSFPPKLHLVWFSLQCTGLGYIYSWLIKNLCCFSALVSQVLCTFTLSCVLHCLFFLNTTFIVCNYVCV